MCALLLNLISSTGLEIENAYIRVDEYSCAKDNTVNARVRAYISKAFADNGASPIEGSEDIITLTVDYSDEAKNAKKQIYMYAKTLKKYENALDV